MEKFDLQKKSALSFSLTEPVPYLATTKKKSAFPHFFFLALQPWPGRTSYIHC